MAGTSPSRMNPNRRSMQMWLLYPKTGTAIIGSGVPSGRYRTLPPTLSVQRAETSFCAALFGSVRRDLSWLTCLL